MSNWILPKIDLPRSQAPSDEDEILAMGLRTAEKLTSLGAVCELEDVSVGPSVVRFDLRACPPARMTDFTRLKRADDLKYELGAESVVIHSPVPGRSVVGVEVRSPARRPVSLGDVLPAAHAPLTAALGLTGDGPLGLDLVDAPHTLLAGRSGAGKSTCIHSIIASLLMTHTPDDLMLVLGDSKMVELTRWAGVPHLAGDVLTSVDRIVDGFWWCVEELMEPRYAEISAAGCRDVGEYNEQADEKMPYVLFVVDELADAMMATRGELESAVVRLGQKGRAAGVHMLLATQTPRAQVFSGLIKANAGVRIALATVTALDSRVILDRTGSEQLMGAGDGYLDDGVSGSLQRFQSPLVGRETVSQIVEHWKSQVLEPVAA